MAGLIAKKLSRLPVGARVSISYGDGSAYLETVEGTITDNDFSTSLELRPDSGQEIILDYSVVRTVSELQSLGSILKGLSDGTYVTFTYGPPDAPSSVLTGRIVENDRESSLEVRTDGGKSLVLDYSVIRSMVLQTEKEPIRPAAAESGAKQTQIRESRPVSARAPVPPVREGAGRAAPLHQKKPSAETISCNDADIKKLYDSLSKYEKSKLSGSYESFRYGQKNTDRDKMTRAAKNADKILWDEYDGGYDWSSDAYLFCAYLLYRVNIYKPELFLMGGAYWEAAFCAYKGKNHVMAGVSSVLALLHEDAGHREDLLIILAQSVKASDDASALRALAQYADASLSADVGELSREFFQLKGEQPPEAPCSGEALRRLGALYARSGMAAELEHWLFDPEPEDSESASPAKPDSRTEPLYGRISANRWTDETGTITASDGKTYPFRYGDILDAGLRTSIQQSLSANLNGQTYWVSFAEKQGRAVEITSAKPPFALAQEAEKQRLYPRAIQLCQMAADTPDLPEALSLAVSAALSQFAVDRDSEMLRQAEAFWLRNQEQYPKKAKPLSFLAQLYFNLNNLSEALKYTEQAIAAEQSFPRLKASLLTQYIRYSIQAFNETPSDSLIKGIKEKADICLRLYEDAAIANDRDCQRYYPKLLRWRCRAECELGLADEAGRDLDALARVTPGDPKIPELRMIVQGLRLKAARLSAPKQEAAPAIAAQAPEQTEETEEKEEEKTYEDMQAAAADSPDAAEAAEEEADIPDYVDSDGWEALKLSPRDAIRSALSFTGPNAVAYALCYLRAASQLNREAAPVCELLSLAANDPFSSHSYDVGSIQNILINGDPHYQVLAKYCAASAFLRACFMADWGYDYSARTLAADILPSVELPPLGEIYDLLLAFRQANEDPIDLYADYCQKGEASLSANHDAILRDAQELYTKFIATKPREGVKFARLLETKKLLFAQDGYLATMLRCILDDDAEELLARKESFVNQYLGGNADFSAASLRMEQIDDLIVQHWEQAAKFLSLKKVSKDLQGSRRNNLRSNIADILALACRWYQLAQQSVGLAKKTDQGEADYSRTKPLLLAALDELRRSCEAESAETPDVQKRMGLYALADTAGELVKRLDGSWLFGQEKYRYADFLNSDEIMLDSNFLPDLTSTFCALSEYHVLARISRHAAGEKLGFQEHLDRIFGPDQTGNNYGTAERILAYLQAAGQSAEVSLPQNTEQFITQTERKCSVRYHTFLESYALDRNRGRIMRSDLFCSTLEDTVRYWYAACRESKNFGFFLLFLQHAEERIHDSAKKYEQQLLDLLDAMTQKNPQLFEQHPDVEDAIRDQITEQNFIVAEDWMNKLRAGDFSMELQQPEALRALEQFWNNYPAIFRRVGDAGRPLSTLLGRKVVRNKDTKGGQQLIDSWLSNGNTSNPSRIAQLLNLLGWKNLSVTPARQSAGAQTEMYEAKCLDPSFSTTPLHPIAAYGSELAKDGMQVVCLYGVYDCDRLYEKIRILDSVSGTKLILLDYALLGVDRRVLAKKMKQRESGLRNTYLLIDRVLVCYLAEHYNENLINRTLMALAMPFSYAQPYVADSILTMPPEIFIGRKDELLRIEQANGVNLIYGGRQLGKSALFKKARLDLDGKDGSRAVLVDIAGCDCAAAAKKLSCELFELGILEESCVTEDWEALCTSIRRRLRMQDDISYLLVMLDEADTFIEDCGKTNYRPLVNLKDVQQTLPGRFKFVLAGLHNVVRFNRDVALGRNAVITHLPSLKITPFRTPEAQELLTVPLSYLGLSLPSKVTVSQILATVNYFPGLIQLYCQKLIESLRAADYAGYDMRKTPPYIITDEHIRRVMADKEFVKQIHDKFEATLKLDQDEKESGYYYPVALLVAWLYHAEPGKLREGFSAKDILRQAADIGVLRVARLEEEKIDALMQELQDLNILRGVSQDTWLLASKNFSDLLGSEAEIFDKLAAISEVYA